MKVLGNIAIVLACLAAGAAIGIVGIHFIDKAGKTQQFVAPDDSFVSTRQPNRVFEATPNFSLGRSACNPRPCYLPVYSRPVHGHRYLVRSAVGHPCEYYDKSTYSPATPYCADHTSPKGDVVKVICQVRRQRIRNDVGQSSPIWDRLKKPAGYVPDMWLGNSGDHHIPCGKAHG